MAVFTGWILILIGLALATGGGWLAVLGGSGYYLIAALGFLATGVLMVMRRPGALWIYALLIPGTGVEVGEPAPTATSASAKGGTTPSAAV